MEKPKTSKRELVDEMLDGGMVMVTLDARVAGVDVPPRFQDEPHLSLNLSRRFGRRLDLGEWGVEAELTFGGVPHLCRLPWPSIYQVYAHATGEQLVFPMDLPLDLIEALESQRLTVREFSLVEDAGEGEAQEEAPALDVERGSELSDEERRAIAYEILFCKERGEERPPESPSLRVVQGGVSRPLESFPEVAREEGAPRPNHLRRIK